MNCPKCLSEQQVKSGKAKGIQRYKAKNVNSQVKGYEKNRLAFIS
jgi:transposase-like protein